MSAFDHLQISHLMILGIISLNLKASTWNIICVKIDLKSLPKFHTFQNVESQGGVKR
jgi:hypothetical protein